MTNDIFCDDIVFGNRRKSVGAVVIWLTGLSGSGKSAIGKALCRAWRRQDPATVLVDGDDIRRILGRDHAMAYEPAARREVAERIAAVCAWLDGQGINVVCCTISAFPDLLERNRTTFSRYFEVFVDVSMEIVERRSPTDIYRRARRGEIANVVGMDIPFSPPAMPDLVVDNSIDLEDVTPLAARILEDALAA